MSEEKTYATLAKVGGEAVVLWCDEARTRPSVANASDEPPEVLVVNAKNPIEFMLGMESFETPPTGWVSYACSVSDVERATATDVMRAFGLSETNARRRDAKTAVETWGQFSGETFAFVPVRELLTMAHDMKVVFSIYAYALGECSDAMLETNLEGGLEFMGWRWESGNRERGHIIQLASKPEGIYQSYYANNEDLALLHGWVLFDMRQSRDGRLPLFSYDESTRKFESEHFGRLALNALMCDTSPEVAKGGRFTAAGGAGWGRVCARLAELLCNGRAAVCENCGNVFARRRNTKRFCSNACKVSANERLRAEY